MLLLLILAALLMLVPLAVSAQVSVDASTSGFGAAFGYAQTIGPIAFTQAGSIGNGMAHADAYTPFTGAWSSTWTNGPAAAFAQSIGTPFGAAASVQLSSFFGGFANGFAGAWP
jgi:hypothetical protein